MKKVIILIAIIVPLGCIMPWERDAAALGEQIARTNLLEQSYEEIDKAFGAGDITLEKQLELKNEAFEAYNEDLRKLKLPFK